MNSGIQLAPDEAAKGDDYHTEQGHAAIERTELEAGVKNNDHRAGEAQDHMNSKPGFD
jgi:hypothetical protein